MNNLQRTKLSIDYIEKNIKDDITLDELADICKVSRFHFHRIFLSIVHTTVMKYIRKRRLSLAYIEIINSKRRIIDIAIDYGFQSQEAFGRAFKKMFHASPGELRNSEININFFKRFDNFERRKNMSNLIIEEPTVVTLEAFNVVGPLFHTNLDELYKKSTTFWAQLDNGISEIKQRSNPDISFALYQYDPNKLQDEDLSFNYIPAVKVKKFIDLPSGFSSIEVPKQKYLVFTHKGGPETLGQTYEYIDDVWIPNSDYELVGQYDFELYDENKINQSNNYDQIDIYIAVK